MTSIGLKYDDRHDEIPKYWVPYTMQSFLKEDFYFVLLDVCLIDLGFGHFTGEVYTVQSKS